MSVTTVNISDESRDKAKEMAEKSLPKQSMSQWIEKAIWEQAKREDRQK